MAITGSNAGTFAALFSTAVKAEAIQIDSTSKCGADQVRLAGRALLEAGR
jgi:hypothetical protein